MQKDILSTRQAKRIKQHKSRKENDGLERMDTVESALERKSSRTRIVTMFCKRCSDLKSIRDILTYMLPFTCNEETQCILAGFVGPVWLPVGLPDGPFMSQAGYRYFCLSFFRRATP